MIIDTNDLNAAYDAYKSNQIMRRDMFRIVCDHIIAMKADIKALKDAERDRVEDAKDVKARLTDAVSRLDALNDVIDTKVATAANSAIAIWRGMNGPSPMPESIKAGIAAVIAPRRGRPPKAAMPVEA